MKTFQGQQLIVDTKPTLHKMLNGTQKRKSQTQSLEKSKFHKVNDKHSITRK